MIRIFFANSLNAAPWKNIKLNHYVYKKETLVFIYKESSIFSFHFAVRVAVEDNGISIGGVISPESYHDYGELFQNTWNFHRL